jgi:hypothetical protein
MPMVIICFRICHQPLICQCEWFAFALATRANGRLRNIARFVKTFHHSLVDIVRRPAHTGLTVGLTGLIGGSQ